MGFDKKADALLSLNPDVAVVPECSEKSTVALQQRGYETLWFGSNPLKGLGVFCRKGWSIRALQQPQQKWIVPVAVDAPTPFTLIAVWACKAGAGRANRYIGQVYQALMSHSEWFDGTPVVLAGDLNSNKIWDAKRQVGNHSDVVKILAERGLVSGYHEFFGEAQGTESRYAFYLHRHAHRPYHIDYIFIPGEWATRLKTVDVGEYEQWSKLSDHCPVTVEILSCQIQSGSAGGFKVQHRE
jgi:exodeoxyribonuclease III